MSLRRCTLVSIFLLMITLCTLPLWAQRGGLKPTVFAIKDARVVTEPGKELAKGTVVIRDGVIQDVGEAVRIPPDALVIDGKDLIVYPGFIDAGSTWGVDLNLRRSESGPPEVVDYAAEALATTKADNRKGITPEFETSTALKVEDDTAEAWRKQGFTARLAVPESAVIAGQSAVVSLSNAAPRETILKSPVALHVAFRAPGQGYPMTLMGTMAHLRQVLLDSGHHARLVEHYEKHGAGKRPPLDPALTSLNQVLGQQGQPTPRLPVVFEADTRDAIHRSLDLAEEFNLRPLIYGGSDAWKAADRLKAADVPVIARINFPEQPRTGGPGRRGFGRPTDPAVPIAPSQRPGTPPVTDPFTPPETSPEEAAKTTPQRVKDDQEAKLKEEIKNLAVLQQKKVRFAISTNGHDKPEKFRENLKKAIDAGLPSQAALQALTLDAARILGVEKQLGTIAPGKLAHLVVMSGNFDDPKSQVRHVFADGVRFEYEPASDGASGGRKPPVGDKDKKPEEAKKDEPKKGEGGGDKQQGADAPRSPEPATELETDRKPKLKTNGNVLIRGATILTVAKGTVKGDLLVVDGKIARLGPNLTRPAGVAVIEGDGLFVMPGIIDTHCHYAMTGGTNEFSLSVVPEVRVRDIIDSENAQIYRALAGGVTTGRILHGSANVIGGQDAVIKNKYGEPASKLLIHDAPRGVKFALGENVKRTDGRFPNTRLGVEAVLVRAFTEARAYRDQWYEYRESLSSGKPLPEPRRDLRLEALADILDGKIRVHCHCYRSDEILMLLRVADRFGIKIASLQHVLEGYKIAPEIAKHGASCSTFSDWWAYKLEAYDAVPFNAALLQEAGASVCLKSDSNELMRHLYQEAAKVMKYGGLTETDALKMITLNGAEQLGLANRLGSIEPGKDADLAIFSAHPLSSYARCDMTLVDGEVYFQRPDGPKVKLPAYEPPSGKRGPDLLLKKVERNPKGNYLLKNLTVHPVQGQDIANAVVLIGDGKIAVVADATKPASIGYASGTTEIDCKGLHLYPGMIDAGTVLGLTELGSAKESQDYIEGGDFQPDLRAAVGINPDSELIPVTRANGVTTVVTRPGGAIIAGQSALINLHGWVPSEMVLVEPLALHIEFPTANPMFFGSDPNTPNLGRMIAKKQRDEKIRRVKELFRQALAYDQAGAGKTPDPRLDALIPYAKGQKPVVIQANRKADILEAVKLAEELKVKMILGGGIEAWKVADELKKRDIPVILGPIMVMPSESYDPYDAPFACAAKLHAAGVKFCIRSGGSTNTRNLPYEAAMAVSYGLPVEEGLKSVTLYPAQILGVADKLGSIDAGKFANLVLTDGDILQATTQVHALFINGVPVEPTSKQTKLYERYRERLKEVKEGRAPLGTK